MLAGQEKGGNTAAAVWKIAEPLAQALGLTLWDVRFVKEGATWYLRIFIDKPGGIEITDCENMSRAMDQPLDDADIIQQSYHLQVSSPGVERDLRREEHFALCLGQDVMLRLIRPLDGRRDFSGKLVGHPQGQIIILLENGEEMTVQRKDVSYIRLDDFRGFSG